MRVDLFLVEKGLVSSRNRAQELIAKGCVYLVVDGKKQLVRKSSMQVDLSAQPAVQIEAATEHMLFVSRGGLKMKGALERTHLNVVGLNALDIGISTGGFADCLLQAGVQRVVGVDVGHGQLAEKLRGDSRVGLLEGVNARHLTEEANQRAILQMNAGHKFDLVVVDVSFISLTLVLPEAIQYLKDSAPVLALVKPQFEVGREGLGKNGVVKNPALYREVEDKIRKACLSLGLTVEDYFESSIEGSDGNREFFVLARTPQLQLGLFDPHRM